MEIKSFEEMFETDISGGRTNSFIKSKGFLIIAGGVAIYALYAFVKRRNSTSAIPEATTTLTTYPAVSGGGGAAGVDAEQVESYVAQAISANNADISAALASQNAAISQTLTDYKSDYQKSIIDFQNDAAAREADRKAAEQAQIKAQPTAVITGSYGGSNGGGSYTAGISQHETAQSNVGIIAQMAANSAAYNAATTDAERTALKAENQILGKSIGASYDSASGKWYTPSSSGGSASKDRLYYTNKDWDINTTTFGK